MSTIIRIESNFASLRERLNNLERSIDHSRPASRAPSLNRSINQIPPSADEDLQRMSSNVDDNPSMQEIQKLWPHVKDSMIKDIIENKFEMKNLYELIPSNQRKGPEEKANMMIDANEIVISSAFKSRP